MHRYWLLALASNIALKTHIRIYNEEGFHGGKIVHEHSDFDMEYQDTITICYMKDENSMFEFYTFSPREDETERFMIHKHSENLYFLETQYGLLGVVLW